jgi:fructokinase
MKALGFGAIVWDEIPETLFGSDSAQERRCRKVLGGAVLNVLANLSRLSCEAHMVSAVGADPSGEEMLAATARTGVCTDLVRAVAAPTCIVRVEFADNGEPSYILDSDVSWDHINVTSADLESINRQGIEFLCFGTIEQRSPESRRSLRRVLEQGQCGAKYFDVNFRVPFYSRDVVEYSLDRSDIAKMNEDEARVIAEMFDIDQSPMDTFMSTLRERFGIDQVCVTHGARGAHYSNAGEFGFAPGYKVEVADTVGAGDGFSAGLLHRLSGGASLADACDSPADWAP